LIFLGRPRSRRSRAPFVDPHLSRAAFNPCRDRKKTSSTLLFHVFGFLIPSRPLPPGALLQARNGPMTIVLRRPINALTWVNFVRNETMIARAPASHRLFLPRLLNLLPSGLRHLIFLQFRTGAFPTLTQSFCLFSGVPSWPIIIFPPLTPKFFCFVGAMPGPYAPLNTTTPPAHTPHTHLRSQLCSFIPRETSSLRIFANKSDLFPFMKAVRMFSPLLRPWCVLLVARAAGGLAFSRKKGVTWRELN